MTYILQFIISLLALLLQVALFILNRVLILVFFGMETSAINLQSERHKVNVLYEIGHEGGNAFVPLHFGREDFGSGIE